MNERKDGRPPTAAGTGAATAAEVTLPPPAPEPPARRSARHRPDALWPTLGGLAALWAALMLVFAAHWFSDTRIETVLPIAEWTGRPGGFERALDPRMVLLLPYRMHAPGISPVEALAVLATHVGFSLDRGQLRALGVGDAPRTIHFDNVPLYRAIHDLLGDPSRGYALIEKRMIFFPQTLDVSPASMPVQTLDWQAELPLSRQKMIIVPCAQATLCLGLRLTGDPTLPLDALRTVQVEVWKGEQWLTTASTELDAAGNGQLTLATDERIVLTIQCRRLPSGDEPGLYAIRLLHQAFQPAPSSTATPVEESDR